MSELDDLDDEAFEVALMVALGDTEPVAMAWVQGARLDANRGKLMRPKEVMELIGISRRTLYMWIKSEKFPRPRAISTRITGWPAGEVNDWLAAQERTRGAA
ncbi:MAG: AlpA family phage regulatory protein [Hyphomicrobiaceae bacterium]